jgi:hypothetical protein
LKHIVVLTIDNWTVQNPVKYDSSQSWADNGHNDNNIYDDHNIHLNDDDIYVDDPPTNHFVAHTEPEKTNLQDVWNLETSPPLKKVQLASCNVFLSHGNIQYINKPCR